MGTKLGVYELISCASKRVSPIPRFGDICKTSVNVLDEYLLHPLEGAFSSLKYLGCPPLTCTGDAPDPWKSWTGKPR